jgi:rod shape determining protein RodA
MKNILKLDWIALISVFLLIAIGMIALFSISYQDGRLQLDNFYKQLVSLVVGLVALFALAFFDYRTLNDQSSKIYFVMLAVLTMVIFWGTTVRGTTGWIGLGNWRIQPVEVAKLVMIIFLASFFAKKKVQMGDWMKIISSIVLVFLPVFLIMLQPDLGSASIIIGIWAGMLIASDINKKSLAILLIVSILFAIGSWFLLEDYQVQRIKTFLHPFSDPQGSGYNVIQSTVAVGSGGIWGKGLGHGSQSQLNFLPEKHTDFIFAVIGEELGLVGGLLVLFLFLVLIYRIKETARTARDNFGYLIAIGVIIMFFLQILVNIGMNIGIMPVAGVPLPFMSYGGSSLVAMLAAIGLSQSVYLRKMKTLD